MPLLRVSEKLVHFVHIPKTGGSSIETHVAMHGSVLLRIPGNRQPLICSPQHFHREIYEQLIPRSACDYAFAIVRNPYDRLLSEYSWNQKQGSGLLPFSSWWRLYSRKMKADKFILDNHLRKQVEFLSDDLEVFRFENGIAGITNIVSERLGLPPPDAVPHRNRSEPTPITVDKQTIESIRDFYADDFELLRYSIDPAEIFEKRGVRVAPSTRLHAVRWLVKERGGVQVARSLIVQKPRHLLRRIRQSVSRPR